MKMIKAVLLSAIFMFVLAGFGNTGNASSTAGNEVKLLHNYYYSATGTISTIRGSIEVENIAYDKQVNIVWKTLDTYETSWVTTPATYAAPTEGNYEAWEYQVTFGFRRGYVPIQFYIEYIVDGNRYIDNNNGANYYASSTTNEAILNKPVVKMGIVGFGGYNSNYFIGDIFLKNLAYHKDVKVIYTTDGWATVNVASASFSNMISGSNNTLEKWKFNVPVSADVKKVEMVVTYTVDGVTYWDTNLNNRNYIIQR